MGTHPIFESDFDCLTDLEKYGRLQVHERDLAQEAIGNDALLATGPRLAVPKLEHDSSCFKANSTRKGTSSRIQGNSGNCRLQNPYATWWPKEASAQGSHHGKASPPRCVRPVRSSSPIGRRRTCRTPLWCSPRHELVLGRRRLNLQVFRGHSHRPQP